MSPQNEFERNSTLLEKFDIHLDRLQLDYELFVELVDRENESVKKADLSLVEEVVSKKVLIADKIESHIREIKGLINDPGIGGQNDSSANISRITLSEVCEILSNRIDVKSLAAADRSRILPLIDRIKSRIIAISKIRHESEQLIQVNRNMLERMVRIHQENYRFWQSVAADSQGTYDASGGKKSETSSSIVKVQI